jgi:hypothetical protein
MGFIRKALYVATLGLSGLVFKEDSKEKAKKERAVKAAEKQVRPRKQTKRAAGGQTKRARRATPRAARTATAAQRTGSAKAKMLGTRPMPQESRTGPAAFPAVEANVAATRHLGDLAIHDGGAPVATVSND